VAREYVCIAVSSIHKILSLLDVYQQGKAKNQRGGEGGMITTT